ncbi:MAG TPA: hypothetical protein PLC98_10975 [Anaerolineales bacterium]|nr:hypothetical protein [Anaerolineales bacterium]
MKYNLASGSVFGLLSLAIFGWLAFGLVWQRGLYMDDYVWYEDVLSQAPGELAVLDVLPANSPARALVPVTIGTAFQVLVRSEFAFRAIAGLWVLGNGALAGWLALRVTARPVVAAFTGALFGLPFVAAEAVLWTGAFPYVVATSLAFATLHAIWTTLTCNRRWAMWAMVSAALSGFTLLFFEAFVSIAGFAILLIPLAASHPQNNRRKPIVLKALTVSALCSSTILGFFALYYVGSPVLEGRGGLVTDPSQLVTRIVGWFQRFDWLVLSPGFGRLVFTEALSLGISTVATNTIAAILGTIALILAVAWWGQAIESHAPAPESRPRLLWMVVVGITWFAVGMSIPGVLAAGQILESRLLYFPYAGLSLAIAAAIDLVVQIAPRHFKTAVGVVSILWIAGSALILVGFARGFVLRYSLDQAQLARVAPLLASANLPHEIVVIPATTTEEIPAMGSRLSSIFVGVFETSWSAASAMRLVDDRASFRFVTGNRWASLPITCLNDGLIQVGDWTFQSDQVILFSLAPDLVIYNSIESQNPSATCRAYLPLSAKLEPATAEAVPIVPLIAPSP